MFKLFKRKVSKRPPQASDLRDSVEGVERKSVMNIRCTLRTLNKMILDKELFNRDKPFKRQRTTQLWVATPNRSELSDHQLIMLLHYYKRRGFRAEYRCGELLIRW